jgi:hypothetical protein
LAGSFFTLSSGLVTVGPSANAERCHPRDAISDGYVITHNEGKPSAAEKTRSTE